MLDWLYEGVWIPVAIKDQKLKSSDILHMILYMPGHVFVSGSFAVDMVRVST